MIHIHCAMRQLVEPFTLPIIHLNMRLIPGMGIGSYLKNTKEIACKEHGVELETSVSLICI